MNTVGDGSNGYPISRMRLYKEWVALTDEEIEEIYTNAMSDFDFIFDTQAKLKEKNSTSEKNIQISDKND